MKWFNDLKAKTERWFVIQKLYHKYGDLLCNTAQHRLTFLINPNTPYNSFSKIRLGFRKLFSRDRTLELWQKHFKKWPSDADKDKFFNDMLRLRWMLNK